MSVIGFLFLILLLLLDLDLDLYLHGPRVWNFTSEIVESNGNECIWVKISLFVLFVMCVLQMSFVY